MGQFLKDYGQLISITLIPVIVWFMGIQFQNRASKKKAKLDLFLSLMSHRKKNPPAIEFVNSLNLIDVVFQNETKVRTAWRAYYDSLHPQSQNFANQSDFLLDLLSEMANSLNYLNLKQTEIGRVYMPQYYDRQFETQNVLVSENIRVLQHSKNAAEGFSEEEYQEYLKYLEENKKRGT